MINLISVLTIWWCPCVESALVLEVGVCLSWQNSIGFCLAFILYSKAKLTSYSRCLDFLLLHSSPLWWNRHLFLVLVLGLVGLYWTIQLQLLPMQKTWVQSLVWEDPTCLRAAKPMHLSSAAFQTQLLNQHTLVHCSTTREATAMGSPHSNKDPAQPKKLNKHLVRSYVKYLLSKAMRTIKLLQTFIIKVVDNLSLYFVWIIHYKENPYFPT